MFDQAVAAGEACREILQTGGRPLLPGVCRCTACERVQMIASPVLECCECREPLDLSGGDPRPAKLAAKVA